MAYNYFLAALSGALLAASFPRFGHPAAAWIALVPLIVAVSGWHGRTVTPSKGVRGRDPALPGQPPLRAFWLGLTAGTIYFVGTIYWTSAVLIEFGGLPTFLGVFAMLLLALYLALYPALMALVTARMIARAGSSAFFFAPAAWVATEYARGFLFGGFPWVPLGNSQVAVLPIAQLASVLGVYGLSGLVALVNASIAFSLVTSGRRRLTTVAATAGLVSLITIWGSWRIADGRLTRQGTPIQVGLIQGNIAQEDKWNPREARRIFTTYVAMTRDAVRRGAQQVIWPESSTPFMFEEDHVGAAAIRDLVREIGVPVLFGSDQVERGDRPRLYNAAFLLEPDGDTAAVYRKIHLVPFGEFIPFQDWITFVAPLVDRFAPFSPGESVVLLPTGAHLLSTAICYEVVYPSLIRTAVANGSELLTTITNDAWYGHSSAPYQHFELASMRAIEHGRYLARAANTGISGFIDPYGRVIRRSAIFEEAGLVEEVRFLTSRTIYTAIGDVIAYVAIALVLVTLMPARRRP